MRWQVLALAFLLYVSGTLCHAGGPAFVAGSGYATGVEGQALLWAGGSVQYFTDQGNLSPILTGAEADAMVASAFGAWTGIAGVGLTATQGGHLAEDVNGGNLMLADDGTISAPADITPSATGTPVGIVYDFDGSVTDALLGEGAGSQVDCFTNAVYGGPDNFSVAGDIAHALVVINGICAATSAQLPDVQYRLTRVLGRVLGLGWSQANVNVLTGIPPTNAAYNAGFPVMHFADPASCVPISLCYGNASVPKMDDAIALAKLYPNSATQPASGRVYGSVYFTGEAGNAVQPMQGVNVVARLMVSGVASEQFVATSVSGFAFCGNAGNIIDGYVDGNGLRYDRWGSSDPAVEGFFDLGQLPIPVSQTIAQYQLSVEALDADWSLGVGPYAPTTVTPSGVFSPVVVTVTNGSNAERDILLLQDEIAMAHPGSGSSYTEPAALPQGGAWGSWISGYGSVDFFQFAARANRSASVSVTAYDETGQPTESKLLPVIGMWQLSDGTGNPAPASTATAFNSTAFALTRLDAQFNVSDTFRVAVADFRGDGRPDYFYRANLLYSDTVTPARISLAGGIAALSGTGFSPQLQVTAAGNSGSVLSATASEMQVAMPPGLQDGAATIQVMDAASGGFSLMTGALTYGALASDLLLLLAGTESATPVGSEGASAIRVRAVASDGSTPVNGATVAWSASNGMQLSACNGVSLCSVLSDEAGESSSLVTPIETGQGTITISLAPQSYTPPQAQLVTVLATSTALDLVAVTPTRWVGQGATITLPLTAQALDLGAPLANIVVNFSVARGAASLSASQATTNGDGVAAVTASLVNQNSDVLVNACVAPNNVPCQTFTLLLTPPLMWNLETVSGSSQAVTVGQPFQPLVMRVTDGTPAANPVLGVNVTFSTTLARAGGEGMPVILGSAQALVSTSQDGWAAIVPSDGSVGPCEVFVMVSAGSQTAQFQLESMDGIIPAAPAVAPSKFSGVGKDRHPYGNSGSRSAAETGVPEVLFASPLGVAGEETATDSHAKDAVELPGDEPSCDGERAASPRMRDKEGVSSSSPASPGLPTSADCSSSRLPEVKAPGKGVHFEGKVVAEKVVLPGKLGNALAVGDRFAGDRRSCKLMAAE